MDRLVSEGQISIPSPGATASHSYEPFRENQIGSRRGCIFRSDPPLFRVSENAAAKMKACHSSIGKHQPSPTAHRERLLSLPLVYSRRACSMRPPWPELCRWLNQHLKSESLRLV